MPLRLRIGDPDDLSQTIELSAAAGRVVDPAGLLRRLMGAAVNLDDSGTVGGVGGGDPR